MCPVCYGDHRVCVFFPCGHGLCRACTERWFAVSDTCPMCREYVGVSTTATAEMVDRIANLRAKGYETTSVFLRCEGSTSLLKKNTPFKYNNGPLQSPD